MTSYSRRRRPSSVRRAAIVVVAALSTVVMDKTALAASPPSAAPVRVVLKTHGLSLPDPANPYARAVLTISQPRLRADGRLVSAVHIDHLVLPPHQSYVVLVEFGTYRSYLCSSCGGATPRTVQWTYMRRGLRAMHRFGALTQLPIHAPSNDISGVAGGWIVADSLVALQD